MLLWCSLKRALAKEGWKLAYGMRSNDGNKILYYERGVEICEVEKSSIKVVYTMHYSKSGEQFSYHNYRTGEMWYSAAVKKQAEEYFKKQKKYKKIL